MLSSFPFIIIHIEYDIAGSQPANLMEQIYLHIDELTDRSLQYSKILLKFYEFCKTYFKQIQSNAQFYFFSM